MKNRAQFMNKTGNGVGAGLDVVKHGTNEYVGHLTFHEGGD